MDAIVSWLQGVLASYGSFFSVENFMGVVTNPVSWTVIGTLIVLEGLLSADNALVLAVMVKHLPENQRKKALFYGVLGAFIFRFVAIGIGVYLVKITLIKVLGGLYLLWMAVKHFMGKDSDDDEVENKGYSFWRTVLAVEAMDIAFSVDSVLAAFGVSNETWVLFLGGILGVLMMRGVAHVFLALINRVPLFEETAFVLIAIIGLKMLVVAAGYHVSETAFFSLLITVFLGTFVANAFIKKDKEAEETEKQSTPEAKQF